MCWMLNCFIVPDKHTLLLLSASGKCASAFSFANWNQRIKIEHLDRKSNFRSFSHWFHQLHQLDCQWMTGWQWTPTWAKIHSKIVIRYVSNSKRVQCKTKNLIYCIDWRIISKIMSHEMAEKNEKKNRKEKNHWPIIVTVSRDTILLLYNLLPPNRITTLQAIRHNTKIRKFR